jgi:hypothetical protein
MNATAKRVKKTQIAMSASFLTGILQAENFSICLLLSRNTIG